MKRAVMLIVMVVCALIVPFALLPLAVRWPSRRDAAVVEVVRGRENAPPVAHLRVAD